MNVATVLFSIFLVLQSCWAADKNLNKEGISVTVLGKSGKVSLSKSTNKVVMEMDALAEYQDTTMVGNQGKDKHSFNTFANQAFEFTDTKDKIYQNLSGIGFNFTSTIRNATITVAVTIFKEAGYIVNDNEEIEVKKGMVKTDISISNWEFCNPCKAGNKDEFGNNLQFTITIKGKNDAPKVKKSKNATKKGRVTAKLYELGANVSLIISKKYKADGVWKDMKDGYPEIVAKNNKQSFVFRFEKFDKMVFYDPAAEFPEGVTDAAGIVKISALFMIVALFINLINIS